MIREYLLRVMALTYLLIVMSAFGYFIQHRHYGALNSTHVILAGEQDGNTIVLNRDSVLPFFAFIVLGEIQKKTALEYSASHCLLVTLCLSDEDRKYVQQVERYNYSVIYQMNEFNKTINRIKQ